MNTNENAGENIETGKCRYCGCLVEPEYICCNTCEPEGDPQPQPPAQKRELPEHLKDARTVLEHIKNRCNLPPLGWICIREKGHPGPCAAIPSESPSQTSEPRQMTPEESKATQEILEESAAQNSGEEKGWQSVNHQYDCASLKSYPDGREQDACDCKPSPQTLIQLCESNQYLRKHLISMNAELARLRDELTNRKQ